MLMLGMTSGTEIVKDSTILWFIKHNQNIIQITGYSYQLIYFYRFNFNLLIYFFNTFYAIGAK